MFVSKRRRPGIGGADDRPALLRGELGGLGQQLTSNELVNRRRSEAWGLRLDVGVGAAAGKVVVGLMGSDQRSEIGVLGDAVNVAARLVAQAGAGEALLAASVYEQVAGSVRAELLGLSPIRGRSGEVEVYRLRLLPRTAEPSAAADPARERASPSPSGRGLG